MPPTTSAPSSTALRMRSLPPSKPRMPCCGKATSWRSIRPRISSRRSTSARSAREVRVADVDVAADVLDAAGELPAQDLADSRLHVVVGQVLDPLGPDGDALEERAGDVGSWLADREHRVEVNVRLDQRRGDQTALEIDGLGGWRLRSRARSRSRRFEPLSMSYVGDVVLSGYSGVTEDQVGHQADDGVAPVSARGTDGDGDVAERQPGSARWACAP